MTLKVRKRELRGYVKEAQGTPAEFRDLLISIARTAKAKEIAA